MQIAKSMSIACQYRRVLAVKFVLITLVNFGLNVLFFCVNETLTRKPKPVILMMNSMVNRTVKMMLHQSSASAYVWLVWSKW